ncbi:Na+/H+ antiporter subunit E [Tomitella biformata]|uniref:Na+/H+ antiporter subunit E n=1 Tax=Tomitella biformata TaxID=630403 RepID=UPI0004BAEB45|nr:Na+/H+ antiporter subunit E [Tomitella biformata]
MTNFVERLRMPMTRRDVLIRVWAMAWLTFVWVLLWGQITIANIVGGILVSLIVLVLMPLPPVPVEGKLHLLSALRLLGRILVDLAKSSVEVAWLACRPGSPPLTAILKVNAKVKSDLVLGLLVDAINVVPGTIVLEVDRTKRDLYIHVLDVGTPERIERFYTMVAHLQHLFIRAFEREEDWQPHEYPSDSFHHGEETP